MKTALAFGALTAGLISLVSGYDAAFNESDWLQSLRESLGRPPIAEGDARIREIALSIATGMCAVGFGFGAISRR